MGARSLGLEPLGIEWDAAACQTREAAGLRTHQGDVAALDPRAFAPCWLLIGSPPCQAFSAAGVRGGVPALAAYREALEAIGHGQAVDRERLAQASKDPRGDLVLEPLRWALALRPRWVALEQVPAVLPLWEQMAASLRLHGYAAWTGILSAECYGVPQTRQRAILMASRVGPVAPPLATHQRYIAPRRRNGAQEEGLFEAPPPERIVPAGEAHLLPWVSMAEALGWADGYVGFPRLADASASVRLDGELYRRRDLRHTRQPAFALTEKARSWQLRPNARAHATVRPLDEPAPTLTGGGDASDRVWEREREVEPRDPDWPSSRPATTVAGDPRVIQPGHKANADSPDSPGRMEGAIRVSIEEALVLQGFPPDYPLAGSKTAGYRQVGDAIPPPLARAILEALVCPTASTAASTQEPTTSTRPASGPPSAPQ